ncbi:MAG: aminotransferase class III-fold pyridoxal phosphate-dependent enzyme [Candidatus Cryptobacteroides sp.]
MIASKQHLLYFPIAVDTVDGDIVTDVDGNRYIDFVSNASCLNLGGSHPITVKAVMLQLEKCMQYCTCFSLNQPMVMYAE